MARVVHENCKCKVDGGVSRNEATAAAGNMSGDYTFTSNDMMLFENGSERLRV